MLQKLSPIFFHTARRLVGKGQGVLALLDCSFRFRLGSHDIGRISTGHSVDV